MEIQDLIKIYKNHPLKDGLIEDFKKQERARVNIKGLHGSASSLMLHHLFVDSAKSVFIVASDKEEAVYIYNDLEKLKTTQHLFYFPSTLKNDFDHKEKFKKSEGNIILRNKAIESLGNKENS